MEAMVGSRRSLRSHPTLALPYFAGEGTAFRDDPVSRFAMRAIYRSALKPRGLLFAVICSLPYFAGEGTYPGEREVHAIEACRLVVSVGEPQRRHARESRCCGSLRSPPTKDHATSLSSEHGG